MAKEIKEMLSLITEPRFKAGVAITQGVVDTLERQGLLAPSLDGTQNTVEPALLILC